MPRIDLPQRRGRAKTAGIAVLALFVVITVTNSAHATEKPALRRTATPVPTKPDAEVMLIDVYRELSANRLQKASEKAEDLVAAYPNFRLGHLLRGDLLLMHTRPVNRFGAAENAPPEQLKDLHDEAAARLRFLGERPNPALVPRTLLWLRGDQKHVLLVDARRSRLYVYENSKGEPRLVTDYYITQGKSGVHKFKEGDQKTPIGVYYITSRVAGAKLPDFFGSGALSINYPNEWDKLNGRGGTGIWLHGTASDNFSRPPLASDGCVVLANPDLDRLYRLVDVGSTPVVIAEQVEFVTKANWAVERIAAMRLLESWRQVIENANREQHIAYYSKRFRSAANEDLQTWFGKQPRLAPADIRMSVDLKDVSQFRYPGRNDLIVSTFTQVTKFGKKTRSLRKRQYWMQEGPHWKIIYEGQV